ncbi:MAG: hypothetical protein ACK4RS_01385 [Thiothrix sp.]
MTQINSSDKILFTGNKQMNVAHAGIATAAFNQSIAGAYSVVTAAYPSGKFPAAGIVVIHSDKLFRFVGSSESAFRTAPPSAGWVEVSASTGGGGSGGSASAPSASPPASPTIGQIWLSNGSAAFPYVNNAMYMWDGRKWKFVTADKPICVASFNGTIDYMGGGGGSTIPTLTNIENNINASYVSGSTAIRVEETGVYGVLITINPGSMFTHKANAPSGDYVGCVLGLQVNGTTIQEEQTLRIISGNYGASQPIGHALSIAYPGNYIAAGDRVRASIAIANGKLDFGGAVQIIRLH